ncbi:TIM barrel protein [Actinomadura sp. NPDC048032]|uniref:TIM barrel protein n=1 Tax=Actinomadura sp. NPDC048032 TaxID=3155747 RepID=UPI0033C181EC
MLRSVSVEMMWRDRPYAERVRAAGAAGFDLVDLWDWRTSDIAGVAAAGRAAGVGVSGFFGNRDHPLCDPAGRRAVLDEIARSLDVAVESGARQLAMFSNAISGGRVVPSPPLPAEVLHGACVEAVAAAADLARGSGVTLVLEHLNTVYLPGYLWGDVPAVVTVAREIADPVVGVAFDVFHQQLCGGRLTDHLVAAAPWLARFDVAGVPGRHEPGTGEVDFRHLRATLDRLGWDGTITFETVPSDGRYESAVAAIDEFFPAAWCRATVEGA